MHTMHTEHTIWTNNYPTLLSRIVTLRTRAVRNVA